MDLCSKNKGADQLRGDREADLRLCFRYAKFCFSQDAAHIFHSGVSIMCTVNLFCASSAIMALI